MEQPTSLGEVQANDPTPAPLLGTEPAAPETAENGQQAAETATETAPTPEARTPESYKLSAPEGTSMGQETLDEIAAYAAERGLSDDVANDLVKFRAESSQQAEDANVQALTDLRQEWRDSLQADPQFGGDNMTKTVEQAKRALDKFGTPALKEALNATGLGDHKELIIAFARVGAQMAEDTLVTGSLVAPQAQKTIEEVFYGPQNKE